MRVEGEAVALSAIGAGLIGLTAANLEITANASSLSLPQSATAIASQIGASSNHASSG